MPFLVVVLVGRFFKGVYNERVLPAVVAFFLLRFMMLVGLVRGAYADLDGTLYFCRVGGRRWWR